MKAHTAVFDGTTAYVIPTWELQDEILENDVEVLGEFDMIDAADDFCNYYNENEV